MHQQDTRAGAIRILGVCAIACALFISSGCGGKNKSYFGQNSIVELKEQFVGYSQNERRNLYAAPHTLRRYWEEEKRTVGDAPEQVRDFSKRWREDLANMSFTWKRFVGSQ